MEGHGGLNRKDDTNGHDQRFRPLRPERGDALVEDESISYGFSGAEFAALIRLCGFRPEKFKSSGSKRSQYSGSYFGHMRREEYDHFSFVAKFDSHDGFYDTPGSFETNICVTHSLDLAFGMIRIKGRRGREWIIPSDLKASQQSWSTYASSLQLRKCRHVFQSLVGFSGPAIAHYSHENDAFEADDVSILDNLISSSEPVLDLGLSDDDFRTKARKVSNATHAVAAIQPWDSRPILPSYLVSAMNSILDHFFVERAGTVGVLLIISLVIKTSLRTNPFKH